jgi:hypothetical protein
VLLKRIEQDLKKEKPAKNWLFLSGRLEATSIEPVSAKFDQIFGF